MFCPPFRLDVSLDPVSFLLLALLPRFVHPPPISVLTPSQVTEEGVKFLVGNLQAGVSRSFLFSISKRLRDVFAVNDNFP